MKIAILSFFLLNVLHFSAQAGTWGLQSEIKESASTSMEIADLKIKYPEHFKLLSPLELSYSYSFTIQTKVFNWVGNTICSPGDSRLTLEYKSIYYSAKLKNGRTVSGWEPAAGTFKWTDPCAP